MHKGAKYPLVLVCVRSERLFDLLETVLTDALTAEKYDVVRICTENAGGLIFLENYSVFVGEDFKRVLFIDVHCLSDADGEYDSAKLVDLSYDSG